MMKKKKRKLVVVDDTDGNDVEANLLEDIRGTLASHNGIFLSLSEPLSALAQDLVLVAGRDFLHVFVHKRPDEGRQYSLRTR